MGSCPGSTIADPRRGLLLLSALVLSACGGGGPSLPPSPGDRMDPSQGAQPAQPAPRPTGGLSGEVPDPLDPIVDSPWSTRGDAPREIGAWTDYWTGRGRAEFQLYLERMGRWDSLVVANLTEEELPASLVYLPVIESGFSPTAVSHASAVGMWQFMAPTARGYGMEVTPLVDERRDPWVATPFALRFLAGLAERFNGSWHLALAGYNAGPGRVERMLERYAPEVEPSDSLYWALRRYLPRETRAFVPKFVAAARVAGDPAGHGFENVERHAPLTFDEVAVPDATSLDVAARAAGVPQRMLEELNPQLVRGLTPAGSETRIRVPRGQGRHFETEYARIPVDERVSFVEHRVAPGETFGHIAQLYGVPVADVRAANPRVQPRRMQIGQRIVVPTAPSAREALRAEQVAVAQGPAEAATEDDPSEGSTEQMTTGATRSVVHEVAPGESLWVIANRYGVSIGEIRAWNRLPDASLLHPGDELVVRTAVPEEYVVRAGDTLGGIARRYGVATADLVRINGLQMDSVIRPGDRVRIPASGS